MLRFIDPEDLAYLDGAMRRLSEDPALGEYARDRYRKLRDSIRCQNRQAENREDHELNLIDRLARLLTRGWGRSTFSREAIHHLERIILRQEELSVLTDLALACAACGRELAAYELVALTGNARNEVLCVGCSEGFRVGCQCGDAHPLPTAVTLAVQEAGRCGRAPRGDGAEVDEPTPPPLGRAIRAGVAAARNPVRAAPLTARPVGPPPDPRADDPIHPRADARGARGGLAGALPPNRPQQTIRFTPEPLGYLGQPQTANRLTELEEAHEAPADPGIAPTTVAWDIETPAIHINNWVRRADVRGGRRGGDR